MDAGSPTAATLSPFNASTELTDLIRARIRSHGPVSFAWFMEQALYHPQFGYYASDQCVIGRGGDYFTNVSVGPVFGRLLAAQFEEIWSQLGRIDRFLIVEQGAHHGEFAADVLEAARLNAPEFFRALRYGIVEPFARLRDRQAQMLAPFGGKVEWRESIEMLEPFVGIHFSNELLDALPVHLIVAEGAAETRPAWREKCVSLGNDQFVFVDREITDPNLQLRVQRLPGQPAGYTTEINLAALDWIDRLSPKLSAGFLLAVDYGYPREEFYATDRTNGTLQFRARHRSLDSPFAMIGQSDITAHVEWTSLAEQAEAGGWRVAGFTDQHHFLTGILSEQPASAQEMDAKTARALKTLLHPEMLGRSFKVLALTRNVDAATALHGFKFARDARAILGL